MSRNYRVVLSISMAGLRVSAQDWTILENTVREFVELDSNDDGTLGDVGGLLSRQGGWVALAYKDVK